MSEEDLEAVTPWGNVCPVIGNDCEMVMDAAKAHVPSQSGPSFFF